MELLLRMVISANQLSVYGAIADLCNELSKDLGVAGKLAVFDHLEMMEIPTRRSAEETETNAQQREILVQEHERKFEQLSEDQKLSKLCSYTGLKLVELEQHFCTLDTEEGLQMQHLCRQYTMPRNEKGTGIRGWIRKDTRIGSILKIKVCYHDERYSVEIQIPHLFGDNTASSVRIVNGVDKYVTEWMLTKKEEDVASGKPIAKARPRQKPTVTLTSASIPDLERKWMDIET